MGSRVQCSVYDINTSGRSVQSLRCAGCTWWWSWSPPSRCPWAPPGLISVTTRTATVARKALQPGQMPDPYVVKFWPETWDSKPHYWHFYEREEVEQSTYDKGDNSW